MLSGAGTMCEPAATEVCLEPVRLFLIDHVRKHARRGIPMVAGDNQTTSCGHALNHFPERIRSQLCCRFATEPLKTVARIGKLVNALVRPMMPKHDSGGGAHPVEAVVPCGIQAFSARVWQTVRQARTVIFHRRSLTESKCLCEGCRIARNFRAADTGLPNVIAASLGFLQ